MLLNVHSYYSLRYGTLSPEKLIDLLKKKGHDTAVLTDINNSSGVFEFVKTAREKGFNALVGMEFRNGDELCFIAIAKSFEGFRELNELMTDCNLNSKPIPETAPEFRQVFVIYPFGKKKPAELRDYEFIGVRPHELNSLWKQGNNIADRCVMLHPVTFENKKGFELHQQLRAVDNNLLLSQLKPQQTARPDETIPAADVLLKYYEAFPQLIINTRKLLQQCSFDFDFEGSKNKKVYGASIYDDRMLLEKLAMDGWKERYGIKNKKAQERIRSELAIIQAQNFEAYFLIAWDVVRYSMSRGFYHVGRGSGANSIVAYCLKLTDVCPMQLDLYFERFLNPRRASPPDFDIDYSWKDRDEVLEYIFTKYGRNHTALLGTMSTFSDRSIIRELGKIYGLPKREIDMLVNEPASIINKHEVAKLILSVCKEAKDFPNLRSIHAGGVLISELPITAYTALDLPPKGFATAQIDMYTGEWIHLEKLDILSQRGIGHINEAAEIILKNRGVKINVHDVEKFKQDEQVKKQLKSADTIGCFYIESPAMRGLLKKLECEDYLTLVAASSIIRPGVAKSGMMREYIFRFHNRDKFTYLHPIMEEQLKETFGVMVYQEDVLKVCHHFADLDLADADLLRRLMSGKSRTRKVLEEITERFFVNCKQRGHPEEISKEVWRQIESFAGYSFSKAHSASYAVESYQSLYLKSHYPLEFMTAVINNFGGFYNTRVYVNEARKSGANIHNPCVNQSEHTTCIDGKDIYLGFVHVQNLEGSYAKGIPEERKQNGAFEDLEDFVQRMNTGLQQLVLLIRTGAFSFTGKDKKQLLWEAHALLNKQVKPDNTKSLFQVKAKQYQLPQFVSQPLEDAYDEMELLGFPVSLTPFDLLRTEYRGDVMVEKMTTHIGETVRMVGHFIASKHVRTVRGDTMNFGTFIDVQNRFFDTTHFPPSLAQYPFRGNGTYLIEGKMVEEFGFPSIEVNRMAKLSIKPDPRAEN